jgi:dienelactone hydrolase
MPRTLLVATYLQQTPHDEREAGDELSAQVLQVFLAGVTWSTDSRDLDAHQSFSLPSRLREGALMRRSALLVAIVMATTWVGVASAAPDPGAEARNFAKILERQSEYLRPSVARSLVGVSTTNLLNAVQQQVGDPSRLFLTDLCWSQGLACAGDVRLNHWADKGYGLVEPVLFTSRTGATLAGHAWATRSGPAKRPLVVITSGSVQATETMYWWAAQALAKAGYVVLTWDPQNQGRSDTLGAGGDALAGVPPQFEGETFFDGTQDALDFALSTPDNPYCPRPSRNSTSHCGKANDEVNPFWSLVDPERIGLAGHSYGGMGVSWMGQADTRVKAVVAWDPLCVPTDEPPSLLAPSSALGNLSGSFAAACAAGGRLPAPKLRVPSMGISGDYLLAPAPHLTDPDPLAKAAASLKFSKAGIDTAQIVIRGGTHYEFSYIPTPSFGATLRGADLTAWYTTAWFDKYVKADPSADARLLTTRWQHDAPGAAADLGGDGNLFSWHFASRVDVHRADGTSFRCEDMRSGCLGMTADDGRPVPYRYLRVATSPDR